MYLIRVDISNKIGTGNFRRMVHLTSEIKNDKIFFLIITDEKNNQIFYNKNVYFTDKKNELKDFTLLVNLKNIQVYY